MVDRSRPAIFLTLTTPFWLIVLPVFAVVMTLTISPALLGWLPFGWNTDAAAQVMQHNHWDAGRDLLRTIDPAAAQEAADGFNLVQANQAALSACREAVDKAGKRPTMHHHRAEAIGPRLYGTLH
jgi:Family of unknown function (DUF6118)